MELNIKNYKNIENLDLTVLDKKINYMFGISGSGKSSIAGVIFGNKEERNATYGKSINDIQFTINPSINVDDCSIFDIKKQNNLLLNKNDSDDMFSIVFSNDNRLQIIQNEISILLTQINSQRDTLNRYIANVDEMIKKINKKKFGAKEVFSKTSTIERLKKEIDNPKYKKYSNFIRQNGLEYVQWLEQGATFELYDNNKCPFCTRKLTTGRKDKLEELFQIKPEQYEIISNSEDILTNLGISIPNFSYKREIKRLEEDLYTANQNKKEILEMYDMIDSYRRYSLDVGSIKKIKLSDSLLNLFPDLNDIIEDFNLNIKELKKQYGELKYNTGRIVKNNLKTLNNYLEMFSIPYMFTVENYDITKKQATVFLISKKDQIHNDRTDNLSYGEKNLIALLLFLISDKSKIVIIDDPASSFDDNRRKIIYELLYEFHNERTFLVLSHDQVFIKYALLGIKSNNNYKSKTGKILYLENHEGICKTKEIESKDFGPLNVQVMDFVKKTEMSYYRKIINLRILAEINKSNSKMDKLIYEYLSAILHKTSKKEIKKQLKDKKITETSLKRSIYDKYKIKIKYIPDNIMDGFNYNQLNNFEKIAFKREEARQNRKNKKKTYIEKEFDDIVHLNNNYFISLNPYKFDIFSEQIYKIL